jgi:hypothetical protein
MLSPRERRTQWKRSAVVVPVWGGRVVCESGASSIRSFQVSRPNCNLWWAEGVGRVLVRVRV